MGVPKITSRLSDLLGDSEAIILLVIDYYSERTSWFKSAIVEGTWAQFGETRQIFLVSP